MRAASIGVQLHYMPVHLQPYYRKLGFSEGQYPSSELYAKSAISLPVYPTLHKRDLYRIVKTLKFCLKSISIKVNNS